MELVLICFQALVILIEPSEIWSSQVKIQKILKKYILLFAINYIFVYYKEYTN